MLVACTNRACGKLKLPHTACPNCGQYDGRQVLSA
jgi:large subunit ribosomal protein L32